MSWELLPTNFTDAVWEGLKKYTQIENQDGTVSFRDETTYTGKERSFFGARDANRMNEALNYIMSMLENGTDLYELFTAYFVEQRTLFTTRADNEFSDFQGYANDHRASIDTIVEAIRSSTDTEFAQFEQYVQENSTAVATLVSNIRSMTDTEFGAFQAYVLSLKQQGDAAISTIQGDYRAELTAFENEQERLFNIWFEAVRGRLTGDIATSLQDQIDVLNDKVGGFSGKITVFSQDGKTITETTNEGQVIVTFNDDGSITEQKKQGGVVVKTKRTTFSADGTEINEEVT